ncbi:MAG: glycosyltransferase family 2 protein [Fuerstiella sp.]
MLITAIVFALLLLYILLMQVKWANRFVDLYVPAAASQGTEHFPHVGVIMALRGADPFLEDSLRGLMAMDYPSHEIRIIIDSDVDPACEVVNRVREELRATHVDVEILNVCQKTSSLKNSALIQGIKGCSSRCESFAWLDSDTVPYPGWLKDLVAPLGDENIGAACGIRWYAPPSHSLSNYVRHIWNSGAVLQMVAFEIGWGGAFAIRRSVYEEVGLEQKWGLALVEDTLASNEVLLQGRRVEFVAACTMPNPESASLSWCVKFVTRQLQGLRYYHHAWRRVLLFGLLSGAVLLGNAMLLPWALLKQQYVAAGLTGSVLTAFAVVAGWLMYRSERRVNAFLGDRAVGNYSRPLMLVMAAPITQIVHLVALVRAYVLSDVTWRGIRYQIRSGMDVTRTNYAPYVPETDMVQHSL